jgi:hypothetical protein
MTKTFNTGISCKYIDRVFQYWMFLSWLHWQVIPVFNVLFMVTLTGYSSVVCHGYIDRVFQYWMFWSWLHWQDIQVLYVMVTLTGYSSVECFCRGYIDRVFQYWMFLSWLHWQGIPTTLEYPVNVTMTKTFNTGIPCQCNHDIQHLNILLMEPRTKH